MYTRAESVDYGVFQNSMYIRAESVVLGEKEKVFNFSGIKYIFFFFTGVLRICVYTRAEMVLLGRK
tara:strand:- start:298 stop:495 length:198 start_codon:yes stop_codon:yes gene_type:complete